MEAAVFRKADGLSKPGERDHDNFMLSHDLLPVQAVIGRRFWAKLPTAVPVPKRRQQPRRGIERRCLLRSEVGPEQRQGSSAARLSRANVPIEAKFHIPAACNTGARMRAASQGAVQ
jgi:hypothetical protein